MRRQLSVSKGVEIIDNWLHGNPFCGQPKVAKTKSNQRYYQLQSVSVFSGFFLIYRTTRRGGRRSRTDKLIITKERWRMLLDEEHHNSFCTINYKRLTWCNVRQYLPSFSFSSRVCRLTERWSSQVTFLMRADLVNGLVVEADCHSHRAHLTPFGRFVAGLYERRIRRARMPSAHVRNAGMYCHLVTSTFMASVKPELEVF
jgi:hypothetical protein